MPWECNTCQTTIEQDDVACPGCQSPKTSWTLVADATRTFVVSSSRKLELLRSGALATEAVAVRRSEAATGVTPDHILTVRLHPRGFEDLTLMLGIGFVGRMFEELVFPLERPADLPLDGHVDVPFLFVFGPGDDPTPDGVHVVDVGEESETGFAPELEITGLKKRPREVPVVGPSRSRRGVRLEIADVHFHHGSAVPLPDAEAGLAVLRACREYAEQHPDRRLLAAGHTDTTGSDRTNQALSTQRASAIHALLSHDRQAFVDVANGTDRVEDAQRVMAWAAQTLAWGCDPGPIDGAQGPKTQAGVKAFQRDYNAAWSASIAVDGVVGPQTWGAIFDVYQRELSGSGVTPAFLDTPAVGCGEHHPIVAASQDEFRSQTNRRVELLFFEPGEEPPLACHADPAACAPSRCTLYDPSRYTFEPLRYETGDGLEDLRVELRDRAGNLLVNDAVSVEVNGVEREVHTDASGRLLLPDLQPNHYFVRHPLGCRAAPTFNKGAPAVQVFLQGVRALAPVGSGAPPQREPRLLPEDEFDDPEAPLTPVGWAEEP